MRVNIAHKMTLYRLKPESGSKYIIIDGRIKVIDKSITNGQNVSLIKYLFIRFAFNANPFELKTFNLSIVLF